MEQKCPKITISTEKHFLDENYQNIFFHVFFRNAIKQGYNEHESLHYNRDVVITLKVCTKPVI